MAINRAALDAQAQLQAELTVTVNNQTKALVQAWMTAWDEVAPDLQDAIDLLIAQQTEGIVAKVLVIRNARLVAALAQIGQQLLRLGDEAGVKIVGDVEGVVRRAAERQAAIIGHQLPPEMTWEGNRIPDQALQWIVDRTTQQITKTTYALAPDAEDAVRRELMRGIVVGSNPKQTAERMLRRTETQFNGGLGRAINIARTEMLDAHRAGAAIGQGVNSDVLTGWVWLTHLDPRTCPACLGMAGTVHPLTEPGPLGHQQCVLPGAVVSGPSALASTTRWFEGEVVDIEVGDGRLLSVTPNHPVLTSQGWVQAGLLREGDHVVTGSGTDRPTAGGRPDEHQIPALIEDVAQTLGGALAVDAVCVPTAAKDFHGDGAGSQVHVVRAHRLLRDDVRAALAEFRGEPEFVVGDMGLPLLAGGSDLELVLEGLRHTARGQMRGLGVRHVLLGRPCRHHQAVGRGAAALLDSRVGQDLVEVSAGHSEVGGERVDRLAGGVALDYPMPDGEDLARFAGTVAREVVLRVSRRRYSGHVYNLQTETGWFLANGILTHNCRCSRMPQTKSWADLGFPGMDEPPSAVPDVDAWLSTLSAPEMRRVLGGPRYDAYRRGGFPRTAWAQLQQNPGWRPSYVPAKPGDVTPVGVVPVPAA